MVFDHWQRAKEPLICVKSHTVDHSHYGYGVGPDGKYSYHWIFKTEDGFYLAAAIARKR